MYCTVLLALTLLGLQKEQHADTSLLKLKWTIKYHRLIKRHFKQGRIDIDPVCMYEDVANTTNTQLIQRGKHTKHLRVTPTKSKLSNSFEQKSNMYMIKLEQGSIKHTS